MDYFTSSYFMIENDLRSRSQMRTRLSNECNQMFTTYVPSPSPSSSISVSLLSTRYYPMLPITRITPTIDYYSLINKQRILDKLNSPLPTPSASTPGHSHSRSHSVSRLPPLVASMARSSTSSSRTGSSLNELSKSLHMFISSRLGDNSAGASNNESAESNRLEEESEEVECSDLDLDLDLDNDDDPDRDDYEEEPVRYGVRRTIRDHRINFLQTPSSLSFRSARNRKCHVCFNDFVINDAQITLACLHRYHIDCISEWHKKTRFCPLCELDKFNSNEIIEEEESNGVVDNAKNKANTIKIGRAHV